MEPNIRADHEMLDLNYKAFFCNLIKTEGFTKNCVSPCVVKKISTSLFNIVIHVFLF